VTTEVPSEADIHCSAEKIFDVIIDFRGQDRWLTKSSAFHGTSEISMNPVTLGTTYREPGPFGVRNGTVTEFERPTKLTFHQPMTIKLHSGIVDVTMRYTLTPGAGSTPREAGRDARDSMVAEALPAAAGARISGREQTHFARAEGLRRQAALVTGGGDGVTLSRIIG